MDDVLIYRLCFFFRAAFTSRFPLKTPLRFADHRLPERPMTSRQSYFQSMCRCAMVRSNIALQFIPPQCLSTTQDQGQAESSAGARIPAEILTISLWGWRRWYGNSSSCMAQHTALSRTAGQPWTGGKPGVREESLVFSQDCVAILCTGSWELCRASCQSLRYVGLCGSPSLLLALRAANATLYLELLR